MRFLYARDDHGSKSPSGPKLPIHLKRKSRKALSRNLCRCTGYRKILSAVQLAGRFLRGEVRSEKHGSPTFRKV